MNWCAAKHTLDGEAYRLNEVTIMQASKGGTKLLIGLAIIVILVVVILASHYIGLFGQNAVSPPTRESAIPKDAVKMTPETDAFPPILYSDEWMQPVPLSSLINTAGAEDSPFVLPDGNSLYFFFTPDVRVPVEKQLLDGVTGIYLSKKQDGVWSRPERVILQDSGKLALDGAEFVQGNTMWFASAREGYTGVNLFTAEFKMENGLTGCMRETYSTRSIKSARCTSPLMGANFIFTQAEPGARASTTSGLQEKLMVNGNCQKT
jgi:hypothetical protein